MKAVETLKKIKMLREKKTINIELPGWLYDRLKSASSEAGVSMAAAVRLALDKFLNEDDWKGGKGEGDN